MDKSNKRMYSLKPIATTTLSQQVEQQLRNYILSGAVSPSDRLTETALAEQLGVGRGPLREAVLKLCEQRLIEKKTYKSLNVRETSLQELKELRTMRFTLESLAFREAWDRRTKESIHDLDNRAAKLAAGVEDKMDWVSIINLEISLHNWVFEVAGNKLLLSVWEGLSPLFSLYLSRFLREVGLAENFSSKVKSYVECAKSDDVDEMVSEIQEHIDPGLKRVVSRHSTTTQEM